MSQIFHNKFFLILTESDIYRNFACIRHTFLHKLSHSKRGLRLIHKASNLGCFTSNPQTARISPNYNYNAAKTMFAIACRNCNYRTTHCENLVITINIMPMTMGVVHWHRVMSMDVMWCRIDVMFHSFWNEFHWFPSVIREKLIFRKGAAHYTQS